MLEIDGKVKVAQSMAIFRVLAREFSKYAIEGPSSQVQYCAVKKVLFYIPETFLKRIFKRIEQTSLKIKFGSEKH